MTNEEAHKLLNGEYSTFGMELIRQRAERKNMTNKQRELIECMNEFCREQCDLNASTEEASDYISRNIDEYKLEMEVQSGMFGY